MDTFRTDLRKLYTLFGTDSRNLGQRGQEPQPLQRLIPLRIGHNIIREYPPRAEHYLYNPDDEPIVTAQS